MQETGILFQLKKEVFLLTKWEGNGESTMQSSFPFQTDFLKECPQTSHTLGQVSLEEASDNPNLRDTINELVWVPQKHHIVKEKELFRITRDLKTWQLNATRK